MASLTSRRRRLMQEEGSGGWIPGLGENKPRPRELGCTMFGYVPDAFSNNLPTLPSESADGRRLRDEHSAGVSSGTPTSSRSGSPGPDFIRGRRRPRTAGDSSQMRSALWQPVSPDRDAPKEIVEEPCVAVDAKETKATPFFDHETCRKILVRGGRIVNEDGVRSGDVLIEEGTVIRIGEDLEAPEGAVVVDAEGKFVLPGGIDTSTHLYNGDAGALEVADDFYHGTRAALAGGTTMVVDVVVPAKEQSLMDAYGAWKDAAEAKAACDYGFIVAVTGWSEAVKAEIVELSKTEGVNAFKVFMAYKGDKMVSRAEMQEVFAACKEAGCVAYVHAENGDVIAENEKRLVARGLRGPHAHLLARPEEAEESAVGTACAVARQVNVPLVVAGPTSKAAARLIGKARGEGQVVLGAPTPAALALDGGHYYNECWSHAAAFVSSPPLRDDPSTPAALVDALGSGDLHMVASEHRTFSMEDKAFAGKESFKDIPEGLNGVEDRLAVVWERGVEAAKMTPEQFVSVTSANAAKSLNIYPRKGCIAEGSDADLVIWNTNNIRSVSAKTHQQKADFNVFEGVKVHGTPEYVITNGRFVVYEYEINAQPGSGNKVELAAFPPTLYDAIADLDKNDAAAAKAVDRNDGQQPAAAAAAGADQADSASVAGMQTPRDSMFGVTTPRRCTEDPVLNKRLGMYQRPVSAHGVRNQQDSTFSLTGDMEEERRSSVKVNAPPGGGGGAFW